MEGKRNAEKIGCGGLAYTRDLAQLLGMFGNSA
jgi:hypothetical protein